MTDTVELPDAFADRKRREILLISGGLATAEARSLDQILRDKLEWAAATKSQFILDNPEITETSWGAQEVRCGRFEFDFTYQRADIDVSGPSPCGGRGIPIYKTYYTNSGMAALAAVLTATRRLDLSRLAATPGHYPETAELAEMLDLALETQTPSTKSVVLLDSAAADTASWQALIEKATLTVFDTSCFAARSHQIEKWVRRARSKGPVIMVRSHAKLDSLGVEYGHLGSIVVVPAAAGSGDGLRILAGHIADAIRVLGVTPALVYFPPFAGEPTHVRLSRQRVAQIIRNSRLLHRVLTVAGLPARLFRHGLYVTVGLPGFETREALEELADDMAEKLASDGLPVRHAGSFGFDFVGLEWFEESSSKRLVLRIASGDVPTAAMCDIATELAKSLKATRSPHDRSAA
jgi:hypothetical protein